MHTFTTSTSRRLTAAALVAVAVGGTLPPAATAGMSPSKRQAYVDSGQYAADLKAALDPAKQYLVRRAKATSVQTARCQAAGFPVGTADPGPDPSADYSVPAVVDPPETVAAARASVRTAVTARASGLATAKASAKTKAKDRAKKRAAKRTAQAKALAKAKAKAKQLAQQLAKAKADAKAKANEPTKTVTVPGPTTTTPGPTVTVAGPTVTVPGPTVTVTGPTTTVATPAPKVSAEDCAAVEKLAIGFDIDETAFSNYGVGTASPNYQDIASLRNQALGTGAPLLPVQDLYRLARAYHVSVFFITARHDPILADPNIAALNEAGALCAPPFDGAGLCGIDLAKYDYRAVTLRNLRSAGYGDVAGLYMRPANSTDKGVVKAAQRAELERRRGYRVIEMVGDNNSDIAGGFYDLGVKIPTLD